MYALCYLVKVFIIKEKKYTTALFCIIEPFFYT